MGIKVAALSVEILRGGQPDRVTRDLKDVDKAGAKAGQSVLGLNSVLKGLGIGFSIAGITRQLQAMISAVEVGEKSEAKLNAVLTSTGHAAGLTAAQINQLSTSMARNTLFDDDTIRDASAMMLTFKNITGNTFRAAIEASADLSTVMGQDLKSSVVQLGKALNDPITGITALQRIGVSFSESQKDTIKNLAETNRLADAQGLILSELASEFGGAAAGANTGLTGSIRAANKAYVDFLESLGRTSTGPFGAFAQFMESFFQKRELAVTPLENALVELGRLQDRAALLKGSTGTRQLRLYKEITEVLIPAMESEIRALSDKNRLEEAAAEAASRTAQADMQAANAAAQRAEVLKRLSDGMAKIGPMPTGLKLPTGPALYEGQLTTLTPGMPNPLTSVNEMLDAQIQNIRAGELFKLATDETLQMIGEMAGTIESGLENTLGDAIANGMKAAFDTGSLGAFFESFGKTMLAGFGDILVQLGKILIQYGLTMESLMPFLTNIFTAGPAAIVAGLALTALGSAFSAAVSGGGGGGRSAVSAVSVGSFRSPSVGFNQQISDATRQTINMGPAPSIQAQPTVNYYNTIIGPDDPTAQRQLFALLEKGARRGLRFDSRSVP